MAKRRDVDGDLNRGFGEDLEEDLGRAQRENPYDQFSLDDEYDGAYEDDDAMDDGRAPRSRVKRGRDAERESPLAGLLVTPVGKILMAVIALLLVLLIGLVVYGVVAGGQKDNGKGDGKDAGQGAQSSSQFGSLPQAGQSEPEGSSETPQPVIFAPVVQATSEPTEEPEPTAEPVILQPTQAPTPQPTDTPEPTETPLPIILTNTPTPSPSPTPEPTPTPTPEPTATPTPSPSPVPDLAKGETNRVANLRESADANAKVKQKVKKGQSITIHETLLDEKGRIWYALTVDDLAVDGYMRDYVVDVEGELQKPTATPKADATPKPSDQAGKQEATPAPESAVSSIGTGKTNREANLRQAMNGKVLTTLRKSKRVSILDVSLDKKGNIWYKVQPEGSKTVGYMRDYVVTLDEGVTLPMPEGAATPTPAPQTEAGAQGAAQQSAAEDDVLSREVVGKAKTNREANVRSQPKAGGKVVRQLSKGVELHVLDKYQSGKDIWYEVATESGKTYGFVRDYVIDITQIDADLQAKTYESK